jgi:hypothetical protein
MEVVMVKAEKGKAVAKKKEVSQSVSPSSVRVTWSKKRKKVKKKKGLKKGVMCGTGGFASHPIKEDAGLNQTNIHSASLFTHTLAIFPHSLAISLTHSRTHARTHAHIHSLTSCSLRDLSLWYVVSCVL